MVLEAEGCGEADYAGAGGVSFLVWFGIIGMEVYPMTTIVSFSGILLFEEEVLERE